MHLGELNLMKRLLLKETSVKLLKFPAISHKEKQIWIFLGAQQIYNAFCFIPNIFSLKTKRRRTSFARRYCVGWLHMSQSFNPWLSHLKRNKIFRSTTFSLQSSDKKKNSESKWNWHEKFLKNQSQLNCRSCHSCVTKLESIVKDCCDQLSS